jgi:hypothetical protein
MTRKTKRSARRKPRRKTPAASGSVVPTDYRKQHQPDEFATRMRKHVAADDGSIDPTKLKAFAETNDAWQPAYAALNVGMRFMNISNRMRGLMRRGTKVKWMAATLVALALLAPGNDAAAQPLTTFRNDRGQVTGYATTRGNVTTFTNPFGQQTGRAERSRDGTVRFFNERGQQTGTTRTGQ